MARRVTWWNPALTAFAITVAGWSAVAPAGSQASLTLVTWFDERPPGSLRGLVIDTDDIEADYQALVKLEADVIAPPAQQLGGIFCMVRDPDGNVVSLHQSGSR